MESDAASGFIVETVSGLIVCYCLVGQTASPSFSEATLREQTFSGQPTLIQTEIS